MARDVMRELSAHIDHICAVLGEPTRIMCLACRVVLIDADSFEVDLEWGEPGDCQDRLLDDEDYAEDDAAFAEMRRKASAEIYGQTEEWAKFIEYAKKMGYGKHYGDPHCIWCLQGS